MSIRVGDVVDPVWIRLLLCNTLLTKKRQVFDNNLVPLIMIFVFFIYYIYYGKKFMCRDVKYKNTKFLLNGQ